MALIGPHLGVGGNTFGTTDYPRCREGESLNVRLAPCRNEKGVCLQLPRFAALGRGHGECNRRTATPGP